MPLSAHLPTEHPRRIFLTGFKESGKSSILKHLAADSPYSVTSQYTSETLCGEYLTLNKLTFSVIDAHVIHPVFQMKKAQAFVKTNADGVVFTIHAEADEGRWEDGLYFLESLVLQVEETEPGPLLLLVTQLDQEASPQTSY
ncbi:hypothetical protein BDZ85DRAFT_277510 [Elsinoe ampelina]|uniref:P-loop containing nucleoside triphosphate hydrolase protein n=1 Tax=Elsinoe ampelina TaxID=302913 RepID=A0A6A6GPF6_9PEZI|nr:hypothetical protein BDZ85DRAFT_277510 [Elsinoe ampelina]